MATDDADNAALKHKPSFGFFIPGRSSMVRIAVLAWGAFALDESGWILLSFVDKSLAQSTSWGHIAPQLHVLMAAVVSLVLIVVGARSASLRKHAFVFYGGALLLFVGFLAYWFETMPWAEAACFCLYSAGSTLLLFFWLELLMSVSSLEAAYAIVSNAFLSAIASFAGETVHTFAVFAATTAMALLCLKYVDDTVKEGEGKPKERPLEVSRGMLVATLAGLCFAGMIAGATQSIAVAASGSFSTGLSSFATALLLGFFLLVSHDINLSAGVKVISTLTMASLLTLLLSSAMSSEAYALASISYGLLSGLAYYVAVLVAKKRFVSPLRVFGIMGVMLFSSATVLLLLSGLGVDVSNRAFVALLALAYALVAIWLLGDRGLDLLIASDRTTAQSKKADSTDSADARLRTRALAEAAGLTPRELDVFVLASAGRSVPFIAEKLVLSENTVKSYLQRVYAKCGVHSRQELITFVEEAEL